MLFAIPKNLVYVFVCIVLFAFCLMLYITATETDLQQFLNSDLTQEVIIVDPLFTSLKESLAEELDRDEPLVWQPDTRTLKLDSKMFFDHFLSENRPLVVREYASDWDAVKYWGDDEYLVSKAGH